MSRAEACLASGLRGTVLDAQRAADPGAAVVLKNSGANDSLRLRPPIRARTRLPGEAVAAPSESSTSNAEYFSPSTRPARTTPGGAALLAQTNGILTANRGPNNTLVPDFFHVPLPGSFFSTNANSFDLTTPMGLKLYRMRQPYTPDRRGFLDVTNGRSGTRRGSCRSR